MKSQFIKSGDVNKNGHLNLFSLTYKNKKDELKKWLVASRKDKPKAMTKDFSPDAVIIIAIHEETSKLVLLKQYRPSVDGPMIEFPAGKIDAGETIEDAAIRELKEETGLDLFEIQDVSSPVYSSSGITDESIVIVTCFCNGTISTEDTEDTEDIEPFMLKQDDISKLLSNEYFDEEVHFDIRAWFILSFTDDMLSQ